MELVVLLPRFSTPALAPYRALAFAVYALGGVYLPLGAAWASLCLHSPALCPLVGLQFPLAVGTVLVGAALYGTKTPERLRAFRGRCDLWPHGHQALHVAVVLGPLLMGRILERMDEHWRQAPPECAGNATSAWLALHREEGAPAGPDRPQMAMSP